MDVLKSMLVAASGMRAQSERMRLIAENIANATSYGHTPGAEPEYRRQMPVFSREVDRALGIEGVKVAEVFRADTGVRYIPGHPAADAQGNVKTPGVETLVEMMDLREAQRSYEANVSVIDNSRSMAQRTIDLLRA
jgi:flagellar basal-body rod protein FlgC